MIQAATIAGSVALILFAYIWAVWALRKTRSRRRHTGMSRLYYYRG